MTGVLSVAMIFRATKGQAGRGEPNLGLFVSSNGLQGVYEMSLFFLALFSPKPIYMTNSVTLKLLVSSWPICHSLLTICSCLSSFFFLPQSFAFFISLPFTRYPFNLSLICTSLLKNKPLDLRKLLTIVRLCVMLFKEYNHTVNQDLNVNSECIHAD